MMDKESERTVWDWEVLLVMGMLVLLVVDAAIIMIMVVDVAMVMARVVNVVEGVMSVEVVATCCCFGDFIPHRPPP